MAAPAPEPRPSAAPASASSYRLLLRLVRIARPYWPHLIGIVLLSLVATPIALLTPLPLKIVVDNVVGGAPLPGYLAAFVPHALEAGAGRLLVVAVAILVLARVLSTAQWTALWLLQAFTGERLALRLRAILFRHVQRLSLTYHDAAGATDSTYRIQSDAGAIENILVWALIPLLTSGFPILGIVVVLAFLDWKLTIIALVAAPLLVFLVRHYSPVLRAKWRTVKELDSSAMSIVQEVLSSLRLVKAYGREDHEERRFVERSQERISGHLGAVRTRSVFELMLTGIVAVALGLVLFVGVRHVLAGILTLGELIMVTSYVGQIFGPLEGMSRQSTGLANGLASIERVFTVLDREPDIQDRPGARPLSRARGHFVLDRVSFRYRDDLPVLENVSLEVPAGACVGIQGTTGSGKSTLVGLLMRLYDPSSGRVLLDGVDLRDYRVRDLRDQFAMVLQDPVLFATSIRENIAYGRPEASSEEVEQAARLANVHDAIAALPEGYDTKVGDRGMTLSGGERQRVALARAFLKDSPILILDEPTSAVDLATEEQIVEALDRLVEGRTTFIIAHRLSTLRRCDIRVSLEKGRPLIEIPTEEAAVAMTLSAG